MKKVLVIGDSCRDVFRYGKCDRLSPEAPVPVFTPTETKENWGMALNVLKNLEALGVDCDIVTSTNQPTKTRFVDEVSNQMLLRVDGEDEIGEELRKTNVDDIVFGNYYAVVISDYNKYFLTEEIIKYITTKHPLVFLDTKKKISDWARGIEILKINSKEFKENEEYLNLFNPEYNIIVTEGKDGAVLNYEERFPIENELEVRDLSGAGDTFLAALVASYIKNDDICESIRFANRCAAWVVSQKGVVTVDLDKI